VIVTSIKKVLIILNIVVSNRYLVWVLDISVYPRILFTSAMFDLVCFLFVKTGIFGLVMVCVVSILPECYRIVLRQDPCVESLFCGY